LPFRGDTPTEVLAKILEVDPDPLPARVPGALTRIIRRSLQKNPDDRYDDARGLVADLRGVRQRLGKDAARRDVLRKARQRFGAGRGWRAAPAILLLALTPLSCWLTLRSRETAVARTITVPLGHRPAVNQASSPRGRPETTDATMATASMPIVAPPSRPRVETARPAREEPPRPRASRLTELDGTNTGAAASSPNSGVLGEPAVSDAAQPPHVGALAVSSNPRSSVSIDGTLVGVTPLTVDAGAGTHEVSLASSDGTRWRGRVEVRAGQPITLHRELGAIGRLTITSDVWVEVSLDGGPAEQTPIHFPRVSTGLHELRAFRDGYVTKHMEIFIEEEKTSTVRLELERR
jgi:hypothetical protein